MWAAVPEVESLAHYSGLRKAVVDVPLADHDRELAFWEGLTGLSL